MKRIAPCAQQFDFSIIYKRESQSLRRILNNKHLLTAIKELLARKIDNLFFFIRTSFIRNSVVLFLHPQTAGFNLLFKLIKSNIVYYYVMDNSFFCLRSYNNHPLTHAECLICVNNPINALSQCVSFPVNYKREENINYLIKLKKVSKDLYFLAQNEKQKELLQMHFGNKIRCTIVGLDTGEVISQSFDTPLTHSNDTVYDLVYHGANHIAKGLGYFVELALLLPEFTCFLPYSKKVVECIIGKELTANNIVFDECTWETGLKSLVMSAKIVINPSLWSAPIEGALLKSLRYNGNVAVVETQYGFSQELVNDCNVLCLPLNTVIAAQQIRRFLYDSVDISISTKTWLDKFLLKNNIDNIFSTISGQQVKHPEESQ